MFTGKRITVGVSGGIAAYKAADVISWLHREHAEVQVVMTKNASRIITPLTLKTLSGRPVMLDLFSEDGAFNVPHIDVADCDLFIVLPATANIMAKAACGLADDLLSAALLATTAPILCAPAMNNNMYANPATQHNIDLLRERGWQFIEPGWGRLACGTLGQGRLADIDVVQAAISAVLVQEKLLAGKKVLVTAGPTYEYIDPVRFVGNRSSGRMGYAVAQAAREAGAEVTLILGPSSLPDLPCVTTQRVTSAQQMYDAVWSCYSEQDIVVMAAAVADYRPESIAAHKIKKSGDEQLHLVRNKDILASLGADKGKRFLVGFAAETENLTVYASRKLREKNLDLIIANNVAETGAGFDGETNIITAIWPQDDHECQEAWPLLSKKEAGQRIIRLIAGLLNGDNCS